MNYNIELTEDEVFLVRVLITERKDTLKQIIGLSNAGVPTDGIAKKRAEHAQRLLDKYTALGVKIDTTVADAKETQTNGKI